MQDYFSELSKYIKSCLQKGEDYNCYFEAEESDFCRFNQGKIRQSGQVKQVGIQLNLMQGKKHISDSITLSGQSTSDQELVAASMGKLRTLLDQTPEDPYLLVNEDVQSSTHCKPSQLGDRKDMMSGILDQINEIDFVGIYAGGNIFKGFANSLGQLNWYESSTFNLDWSLYAKGDKAVKQSYAGYEWHPDEFENKLKSGLKQLEIVKRPAKTIDPGKYRVYLSPAALDEIVGILSWGGFGLKSRVTKSSSLMRLHDGSNQLSDKVSLFENIIDGVAPNFDKAGFIKPDNILLVDKGKSKDTLVSARSAKEYGVPTTGANHPEMPEAIWMNPGELDQNRVLESLDTGLYINNLWYMNYSDRIAGRMTGMTRFASFWVEKGEIIAPLNVMRFDESVYNLLGTNLESLTSESELMLSNSTYDQRSTNASCLPGALISNMSFTL